jgi:type III secretory pathway component EscV
MGQIEKDPVMLTEHIRAAMRRYISFRYALGNDTLFVYLLDPEIEDVMRGAIRRTSSGSFLSLDRPSRTTFSMRFAARSPTDRRPRSSPSSSRTWNCGVSYAKWLSWNFRISPFYRIRN